MPGGNFNMLDPTVQEDIRRKPHEYVATEGKHGMYREKPYVHQEYPKMMGKYERPTFEQFTKSNGVVLPGDVALVNFQAALTDWNRAMAATVVHNKSQEREWLANNAK